MPVSVSLTAVFCHNGDSALLFAQCVGCRACNVLGLPCWGAEHDGCMGRTTSGRPLMGCRAIKTHVAYDKEIRLRTKGYMGKSDRQPSVMKGTSRQWML